MKHDEKLFKAYKFFFIIFSFYKQLFVNVKLHCA